MFLMIVASISVWFRFVPGIRPEGLPGRRRCDSMRPAVAYEGGWSSKLTSSKISYRGSRYMNSQLRRNLIVETSKRRQWKTMFSSQNVLERKPFFNSILLPVKVSFYG